MKNKLKLNTEKLARWEYEKELQCRKLRAMQFLAKAFSKKYKLVIDINGVSLFKYDVVFGNQKRYYNKWYPIEFIERKRVSHKVKN